MQTSYFACSLIDRDRHFLVQVSNSVPKGFSPDTGLYSAIPDWRTIVAPFKDGFIDTDEYRIRYRRQLDGRKEWIRREMETVTALAGRAGKEPVLVCYERTGDFCHRHILAGWLKENLDVEVFELEEPRLF